MSTFVALSQASPALQYMFYVHFRTFMLPFQNTFEGKILGAHYTLIFEYTCTDWSLPSFWIDCFVCSLSRELKICANGLYFPVCISAYKGMSQQGNTKIHVCKLYYNLEKMKRTFDHHFLFSFYASLHFYVYQNQHFQRIRDTFLDTLRTILDTIGTFWILLS